MKIEITDLTFSYGKKNKGKDVLKNLSLSFLSGNCYLLMGKNGTGKTTLSKLIIGLLKSFGEIKIDGEDISKMNVGTITKKIGYVFQNPDLQFFSGSVAEEFEFPFKLTNTLTEETKQKIDRLIKDFNLTNLTDRHPLTLSVGEKQRLAISLCLLNDPPFLLLDEPTASIDEKGRIFIANSIKNLILSGKGIIVITHDETLIELLGDIAVHIDLGEINEI